MDETGQAIPLASATAITLRVYRNTDHFQQAYETKDNTTGAVSFKLTAVGALAQKGSWQADITITSPTRTLVSSKFTFVVE